MISRLHYFSDVHGLGGQLYWQNKNNAMINYLMWRVMDDTQTLRTHFSSSGTPNSVQIGVSAYSSAFSRGRR